MIKMVATDIDGTILPYNCDDFHENVKACIKKLDQDGVKVILVTGRMHSSTTPIAKKLGLNNPVISYQGGLVKNLDGETIYQANLDSKYAKEIIQWGRANNVHLNLYIDDKLYVENDNETIKYYIKGKFVDYTVCSFDDLEIKNVNKLLAIDLNDAQKLTSYQKFLQQKYPNLYIVKSTPYYCEINPNNAKKSIGVEVLCNMWGINKNEVLTIGDQNNDIDLVKVGGVGVAMGNATEELKQCADYITDTVENDGFVKAINKFVYQTEFI